jgi:hypothetical protein
MGTKNHLMFVGLNLAEIDIVVVPIGYKIMQFRKNCA